MGSEYHDQPLDGLAHTNLLAGDRSPHYRSFEFGSLLPNACARLVSRCLIPIGRQAARENIVLKASLPLKIEADTVARACPWPRLSPPSVPSAAGMDRREPGPKTTEQAGPPPAQ